MHDRNGTNSTGQIRKCFLNLIFRVFEHDMACALEKIELAEVKSYVESCS